MKRSRLERSLQGISRGTMRTVLCSFVNLSLTLGFAGAGRATVHRLESGMPPESLRAVLAEAAPGDRIEVVGGSWSGPLVLDRPVSLVGDGWPVIDGGGLGTVIEVHAPGIRIEGFVVRGSGTSLDEENSGIAVEAPRASILRNRFEEVLFGVYLREAPGSEIRGNRIRGMDLDMPRRGDAIRVWSSGGVVIQGNEIRDARDVVLWYSSDLTVVGNRVERGRYGLHFMYCDDADIRDNSLLDNSVGAFLMYSRRLRLTSNTIAGNHGPSGYGVGLKDMDDAVVSGNLFVANRVGGYLDNSPRDIRSTTRIENNLFAGNDIGVTLLPNVRRATFQENSFVENQEQVTLAGGGGDPEGNTWVGNHWSDYRGYDADRDGFGDVPYRSDRLFESLTDRHAELRLFRWSPSVEAVELAARAFPIVRPRPKLTDPAPRMAALVPASPPPLGRAAGGGLVWVVGLLTGLASLLMAGPRLALAGLALREEGEPGGDEPGSEDASRTVPRAVAEPPLLEADSVTKRFGDTTALDSVTFRVGRGEAVALWGPNGAGKTTALRALLGVMPHDGTVRVDGLDTGRRGKEARKRIGFVPQESSFPDLGTREVVELFARLHRAPLERIPELFHLLGLEGEEDKPVRALSGGRKQRLALAAALVSDPPILLLDEPTANLDIKARQEFLGLLRELKRRGKTIVFSTHRLSEVRALADRVLRLEAGRLVSSGSPEELGADEGRQVELELTIRETDLDRAVRVLTDHGFATERRRHGLLLRVAAGHKIDPLAALVRHGIAVTDFLVHDLRQETPDA